MLEWTSGMCEYRKHSLSLHPNTVFTLELTDSLLGAVDVNDAFQKHLECAPKRVEVLYSGGLDSECVLVHCMRNNIPVTAITMRLLIDGNPFNTHDLYYAEKFCRENGIKQEIIDLNVDKFFSNGDHLKYSDTYHIINLGALTMFWLIDQCHNFPIIGGDYTWPLTNINRNQFSPHRHAYACYDHYMTTKGINGIGNMISHSLDSNIFFINEHLNTQGNKQKLFENLGFSLEPRHRSYGWEAIRNLGDLYDFSTIINDMLGRYGKATNTIRWNHLLANLIGSSPGENNDFGK